MTKRNRTTSGSNWGLFNPFNGGVSGQYNPGGTSSHGKAAARRGTGGKVGKYKGKKGTFVDSKGVERYHTTGNATKEWKANQQRQNFLTNLGDEMGKTPEIPLATINKPTDFGSVDINQINKDRRVANENLYGGIGKEVKQVTNFMSDEKWNALPPDERKRMNESYTAKNTKYFGTDVEDERNIFGKMELSERDAKLQELLKGKP